jgi:16S rRNA (cytidine1402-2'-O)-methyltransferase
MERGAFQILPPIQDLSDLTPRAAETLRSAEAIAFEEGAAVEWLEQLGVRTQPIRFHAEDPDAIRRLCDRVDAGEAIAAICARGAPLVKEAIRRGLAVVPIPGTSRLMAAVYASGLSPEQILLLRSLPRTEEERREVLSPLRASPYTLVIEETPRRLVETLKALERILGDRRAAVARDLGSGSDSFVRDRLSSLSGAFVETPKQDVVIVVGPSDPSTDRTSTVDAAVRSLLAGGMRPTEAARAIATTFGLTKKEAYRVVMEADRDPNVQRLEDLLLEKLRAYTESLQGLAPENLYGLIMPQLERPLIRVAMEISGGRQIQAAEMLGIHRNTLRMKLRSLGLDDRSDVKEEA